MLLLTTQDFRSCIRLEIKMAGLPIGTDIDKFEESFLKQAKVYEDFDMNQINKVMKIALILDRSYPWTVLKAAEYVKWIESGEYEKIIDKTNRELSILNCKKCGADIMSHYEFCKSCGYKLSA